MLCTSAHLGQEGLCCLTSALIPRVDSKNNHSYKQCARVPQKSSQQQSGSTLVAHAVINETRRVCDDKDMNLGYPRKFHEKYCLLKLVGRGGYAEVWRATGRHSEGLQQDREYAVKILNKYQEGKRPIYLAAMAIREVAAMTLMKASRFTVQLHDVQEDEEHVFIVMEYLQGGSLHDLIRARGRLDDRTAALSMFNILHSIRACQKMELAHRDIKPGNFVYTSSPVSPEFPWVAGLKLVDFGVSMGCQGPTSSSRVGTRLYYAPEVCGCVVAPNSDMWSAGITLYRMLSGLYPYWDTLDEAGKCNKDVLMAHIRNDQIDLSRHEGIRDASPEARDLLARLLVHNPSHRLAAAEALQHPWILKHAPLMLTRDANPSANVVPVTQLSPTAVYPAYRSKEREEGKEGESTGGRLRQTLADGLELAAEVMAYGGMLC